MHSFLVPVRKTKMNETRETEIASQVVFLQFSFFFLINFVLHFFKTPLHPPVLSSTDLLITVQSEGVNSQPMRVTRLHQIQRGLWSFFISLFFWMRKRKYEIWALSFRKTVLVSSAPIRNVCLVLRTTWCHHTVTVENVRTDYLRFLIS